MIVMFVFELCWILKCYIVLWGMFCGKVMLIVLDDLLLMFMLGWIFGLVGESGCGKSIVVNIMLGLL